MEYNVSQLLKSGTGTVREYDIEPGEIDGDQPIRYGDGRAKLTRTPRGILAAVRVPVTTECVCGRCLESFECSMDLDFEEEYFPVIDVDTGAPAAPIEEGAFVIDEHHILDLDEAIRQYAIISLPMQPVCRETCAGLCPVCGKRRDIEPCTCEVATVDPRLAPLAALLHREEKESA